MPYGSSGATGIEEKEEFTNECFVLARFGPS
jgi:hypothetical protein